MKTPLVATVALALALLASCNTMRGAGQDVQAGGAAVSTAATSVQTDMQTDQAAHDAQVARDAKAERDRQAAAAAAH